MVVKRSNACIKASVSKRNRFIKYRKLSGSFTSLFMISKIKTNLMVCSKWFNASGVEVPSIKMLSITLFTPQLISTQTSFSQDDTFCSLMLSVRVSTKCQYMMRVTQSRHVTKYLKQRILQKATECCEVWCHSMTTVSWSCESSEMIILWWQVSTSMTRIKCHKIHTTYENWQQCGSTTHTLWWSKAI